MLEPSAEGAAEAPGQRKPSERVGRILQDTARLLSQRLLHGTVSPIGRIPEFRKQGEEAALALPTITPSDPLSFLSLQAWTLDFLKVLVSQRDPLMAGDKARVPLNSNLLLPAVCFELLAQGSAGEERNLYTARGY